MRARQLRIDVTPLSPDVSSSIILIGDSITLRNGSVALNGFGGEGYFTVGNMLMGNRFFVTGVFATSGATISVIASTLLQPAMATLAQKYFLLAGTNDLGLSESGDEVYTRFFNTLLKPLLDTNKTIFVGTVPPNNGWTNKYTASVFNQRIRREPANYSNCVVIDFEKILADNLTGNWRSGLSDDGIHPNPAGALYMGTEVSNTMSTLFSNTLPKYYSDHNYDALEYSPNPRVSGNNASGVNKFTAVTVVGTGPDSAYITATATATGTCTGNIARLDNLAGGAFEMVCSFAANGDSIEFRAGTDGFGASFLDRVWSGTAARTIGEFNIPTAPNGFLYKCVVGGTTAAGQPTWPTTLGATVVDGSVTWLCVTDLVTGSRLIHEVYFSIVSMVGQIFPRCALGLDNTAQDGTLRPAFELNNTTFTSSDQFVYANTQSAFTVLYSNILPLNTLLKVRTPVLVVPANTAYLKSRFRIFGTAGSSCTVRLHGHSIKLLP